MQQLITERVAEVLSLGLVEGAHRSPEEGMCYMEAWSYVRGLPHSDRPNCFSPVIGSYVRHLNDRRQEFRDALAYRLDIYAPNDPALEPLRGKELARGAFECAELVLPVFEAKNPNDKRPREVLDIVRKYLAGEGVTRDDLIRAGRLATDAAFAADAFAADAFAADAAFAAASAAAADAAAAFAAFAAAAAYRASPKLLPQIVDISMRALDRALAVKAA